MEIKELRTYTDTDGNRWSFRWEECVDFVEIHDEDDDSTVCLPPADLRAFAALLSELADEIEGKPAADPHTFTASTAEADRIERVALMQAYGRAMG